MKGSGIDFRNVMMMVLATCLLTGIIPLKTFFIFGVPVVIYYLWIDKKVL